VLQACIQLNSDLTQKKYKLQWTIPYGNITKYRLYIKQNDTVKYIVINKNKNNYYIKDLNLISNNEYEFWIVTLYGDIEGKPSNKIKYIK